MSEPITCNLAENALDYLLLAGEQAREGSPRMMKHAVATLGDGLELLLKARLEAHDWRQVFSNPAKADLAKYQQGDFHSVHSDTLVERLEQLCSVTLDPHDAALLENIREYRNRIRHFAVSSDQATVFSLVSKALAFALAFVADHLEPHCKVDVYREVNDLREMLGKFDDFVDTRLGELQSAIDSQRYCPFLECPTCFQPTFFADGEGAKCLFCERRLDGEAAARLWVLHNYGFQSPKDQIIDPQVEACPECGAEACINASAATDGDLGYVCLNCGESGDFSRCTERGCLYSGENLIDRCDDCYGDFMDRND